MSCNSPMAGWLSKDKEESGKRRVVFRWEDALVDRPMVVPCGKCVGCRLEQSRQWAVRIMHEAQLWQENRFVTLTYDAEHVPRRGPLATLDPEDWVKFAKRLREWHRSCWMPEGAGEVYQGIRFFQAGEYGALGRPHHHAILFNVCFPDEVRWSENKGSPLYRSALLERLWPHGFSTIGEVAFESAAYVARYAVKKLVDDVPECVKELREPEYCSMSRKPGIGSMWLAKYLTDVYPHDRVVTRGGKVCRPPRFYDKKLESIDSAYAGEVKSRRRCKVKVEQERSLVYEAREETLKAGLAARERKV